MRRIALVTLLAFGCATARPPERAAVPPGLPARIALAEPELELWMEGTRALDPAESDRTLRESRDALSRALSGRGLDASEPEQVLVVRERAIARTGERKIAQVWSTVGIVIGFVVVAVVAILLSRSKSPSGGRHASHTATPVWPRGAGGPRPAYLPPRSYPVPPPIGVSFGFTVFVPVGPVPPVPWVEPTESWLASRGWLDGDEVELTVELADPATGEVSWHRTLRDSSDPRDAAALSALIDRALEGEAFGHRQPHSDARVHSALPAVAPEAPLPRETRAQNTLKLKG